GIEKRPRLNVPVHLAHPLEARLHELGRRDGTLANHPRGIAGAQQVQVLFAHRAQAPGAFSTIEIFAELPARRTVSRSGASTPASASASRSASRVTTARSFTWIITSPTSSPARSAALFGTTTETASALDAPASGSRTTNPNSAPTRSPTTARGIA